MRQSDLEDLCSVIGYTATEILKAWFSGRLLYIPIKPDDGHPFARLIGGPALRALSGMYGGERLRIPDARDSMMYARDRLIAEHFAEGKTPADVAARMGITERRCQQIRNELNERGWIDFARGAMALTEQESLSVRPGRAITVAEIAAT